MRSPDEDLFYKRINQFKDQFLVSHLEEVGYVKTKWLDPYKEKLIKAWVNQHPHFGNVVTSRAEGIHGLLKDYLRVSTLDLFEAWRQIKYALLNQLAELKANQAKQQIRLPIELSGPLYSIVRGWVSYEALRMVEEQRQLLTKTDPPYLPICTGSFSRSQGLPCSHTLRGLLELNQALRLEHFHPHWHLHRNGAPVLLLEPRQHIDKITIDSTIPRSSTQREPSAFEAVENTIQSKAPFTCSACHAVGHRMNSKICPLRYAELLPKPALVLEPLRTTQEMANPPAVLPSSEVIPSIPAQIPSPILVASRSPSPIAPSSNPSVLQLPSPIIPLPLSYDDPRAIYQRYVKARDIWYKAQPRGSIKTNQQYRKAMSLPLRYGKASYDWCLDYKQMTRRCTTSTESRDWTKEEMMTYLDWSNSEDDRIDALVAEERAAEPFDAGRRGMGDMWRRVERDMAEQELLHADEMQGVSCTIVETE